MNDDILVDEKGIIGMVERYFSGRCYIGLSDVAGLLGVSPKTVKRHVDLGSIRFSTLGHGRRKIRRAFTAGDVTAFCMRAAGIAAMGRGCGVRARRVRSLRRIGR